MEKKYVCSLCGKEFTPKEGVKHSILPMFAPQDSKEMVFSPQDTTGIAEDLVFCSRHCQSEYEHGKRKDW